MEIQRDYIMPAALYGMYEMELHPLTLSFPKNLEKAFRYDFFNKSLTLVRFSLLLGIVIYAFFGILDAYLVPEMTKQLWVIRFAVVCPFLLGIILYSYSSMFRQVFQVSVTAAMVVSGFGIIYMILIIPSPAGYSYYAGLILVLIWGYTFTRVRFIWATLAGWLIVASYEIVAIWIIDTPKSILLGNNFFFVSANLAGMLASYSIEYYARRDFFLMYKLENERQIVEAANQRLEVIVKERTAQLLRINEELKQEIEERKASERKRVELESMFQQAQKMEAMGTLAGGIAHDFNNLLMGVQGHVSLMLMDTKDDNSFHENLCSIEQYVQTGTELTAQLLAFARGGKYEVKATDLNELVKKSSYMFGRTKKEITIHTELQKDIWFVDVDQGQIEQVLLNLFVNAWQAMPNGGDIYIRTENDTLDDDRAQIFDVNPGKYVRTMVQDTGIGIDESISHRIFDPFFSTKDIGRGAGLRGTGLGLCQCMVSLKNHDGFITVDSVKNKGSLFSFYLPVTEKKIAHEKIYSDITPEGAETILLVDDEEIIVTVTARMMKRMGYRVLVAMSGEEAVNIYREKMSKIDMVIVDMVMPGIGGSETYDALKNINSNVKVLLSSGYSLMGEATKILDRGCNGFLQKPFNAKQLSQKIREILDVNSCEVS